MAFTHTVGIEWRRDSVVKSYPQTLTGTAEANVQEAVSNGGTDVQINVAIDFSALKSLVIYSDQDVTIETNSGSAADDTLTIAAGVPLIWYTDCGHANPLSADVTALFVTNASGSTANIEVYALMDATP